MDPQSLDRRALLRQALLLAGAGAAASACTTLSVAAEDSPFRLGAEQMAVLSAAADTLVPATDTPGALAVSVPALFEGLMADWASPETRASMSAVLDRLDGLAQDGRSFAALTPAERLPLLRALDAAALAPVAGMGGSPFGPPPAADPPYQQFKQLVLTLFYYSQPALTRELSYVHVPGRWQPSIPVTDATRPAGGPGMF